MLMIVTADTLGSQLIRRKGKVIFCTSGELKKGTIVEVIEYPKQFPEVIEVRVVDDISGTSYQIVKNKLELIERKNDSD